MATSTAQLVKTGAGLVITVTYDDQGLPVPVARTAKDGGVTPPACTQRITSVTVDTTAAKNPVSLTVTLASGPHTVAVPAGLKFTVPVVALRMTDVLSISGSC